MCDRHDNIKTSSGSTGKFILLMRSFDSPRIGEIWRAYRIKITQINPKCGLSETLKFIPLHSRETVSCLKLLFYSLQDASL